MTETTVHLSDNTHRVLQALSGETGKRISEILEEAVEEYRRKIFFEGLDRDYAALKADPDAWSEELQERKLFENTLMDGIDPRDSCTENSQPEA
jgi:hypothetical protein